MSDEMKPFDALEIARIIGEPRDPRRPYPLLVEKVCDTDTAEPNEYVYQFDVLLDTDKIITTVASGLTTTAVTPDTPVLLTFTDLATDEYWVKITDLASAKERVLARKKATINRALNAEENKQIIDLADAAAISAGNLNDLRSGETSFHYGHLIDMIDQVIDYSENYVLISGTQIDKDIKLWDWKDSLESPVAVMLRGLFGYIGETPERTIPRKDLSNQESVTTTRQTPQFNRG